MLRANAWTVRGNGSQFFLACSTSIKSRKRISRTILLEALGSVPRKSSQSRPPDGRVPSWLPTNKQEEIRSDDEEASSSMDGRPGQKYRKIAHSQEGPATSPQPWRQPNTRPTSSPRNGSKAAGRTKGRQPTAADGDGDEQGGSSSAGREQQQNKTPKPNENQVHSLPAYLSAVPITRGSGQDKGSFQDRGSFQDKGTFFSMDDFRSVGATQEMVTALRTLGITRPSHIQAMSYEALSSAARHVVVADAAGSGKTLAYLAPLMQRLKTEERLAGKAGTQPRRPRLVVLAPTSELVQQVYRVVKAVTAAGVPLRSLALSAGGRIKTQKDMLQQGIDVVVATPGRLMQFLREGWLELGGCNAVVMDEVDILMGDSAMFKEQMQPLLESAGPSTRFVMATATLPEHTFVQLQDTFPDIVAAFGPGLHKIAAGVVEELVDCSGGEEPFTLESGTKRKLSVLGTLLERHAAQRAIVFCNKIEACRDVENHLRRLDRKQERFRVLAYHAAIDEGSRQEALNQFLAPTQQGGLPLYLICTDRTSRGLDSAYCEHVVLFDFPRDPSEYVRRVGRTARGAGGQGVVSVMVIGKQVKLAQDIISRNQKGAPVHRIPDAPMALYPGARRGYG